ncbi:MAG TPA: hypothetical protein VHQ86_00040, partial [Candidatus Saccharimonadia bacterium]|nr:hypothetical protein [Candidatus Saccharimonadia bacterium]
LAAGVSFSYETWLSGLYGWLQNTLHTPGLGNGAQALVSLVFMVLLAVSAYWLGRLVSLGAAWLRWPARDVAMGIGAALAATFVFQLVPLAWALVLEWPQFFYHPPAITARATTSPADKPDVYYIVLDRYTSSDVLGQQFGFDNSDFVNFLSSLGYYTNPSAHNNYPYTTMSIASTMDADYLNDIVGSFSTKPEQTVVPFNQTTHESPVAQKFKDLGYKYTLIGNWYETSNSSGLADETYQRTDTMTLFDHPFILNNFPKNFLTQGPFWRFIRGGLRIGSFKLFDMVDYQSVDMTHYELQSLRDVAAKPSGGRFIFAHILVPHDPYFFNADGSPNPNPDGDSVGKPVKQKYLGQVQFINSQMKDILTQINTASSGKAVVVLQSDEGPYPTQLGDDFDGVDEAGEISNGDMRKWTDASLAMKFGNLAAYHIPAADFSTQADAADSVNVFRLVFNTYFGTGLPYLPDCYYAYPDGRGRSELFADITPRLTGQPSPEACRVDGSVKE